MIWFVNAQDRYENEFCTYKVNSVIREQSFSLLIGHTGMNYYIVTFL